MMSIARLNPKTAIDFFRDARKRGKRAEFSFLKRRNLLQLPGSSSSGCSDRCTGSEVDPSVKTVFSTLLSTIDLNQNPIHLVVQYL